MRFGAGRRKLRGEYWAAVLPVVRGCADVRYRYKARGAYESILPLLDEAHAEQIAKGIVSEADKKSNANFPF